jgi:hypothetical protein
MVAPGHAEDLAQGATRKAGDVFKAFAEPLLRDCGNKFAVHERASRGVGMKSIQSNDETHVVKSEFGIRKSESRRRRHLNVVLSSASEHYPHFYLRLAA